MLLDRIKYRLFFLTFLAVATVFLASFSPSFKAVSYSNSTLVSIPNSIISYQSNTYVPEFDMHSDSIVIPLKRTGRLFFIEANVDDETGNLVFDTGANGLVLNSTYFRNHVKSGGSISTGITGSVGTVEQISISKIEL